MRTTPPKIQSRFRDFVTILVASFGLCVCSVSNAQDPLPSWNDGSTKNAILEFVAAVTDENGKDFVKPADRIATFDNDGTLWGGTTHLHPGHVYLRPE